MNTTEENQPVTPASILDMSEVQFDCIVCGSAVSVPAFLKDTAMNHGVMCDACCAKDAARITQAAIASSIAIREDQWNDVCPRQYQDSIVGKLPPGNRLAAMLDWEYGAKGWFLVGKTRAGKSRCSWLLAKREFMAGKSVRCLGYASAFEYGSKFQDGVKDAKAWIEKHCECDILILDDVFKAKLSDSFEQALFAVVAYRTEDLKPMIVTANDNFDTLKSRMSEDRGPALVSRLREFCQVLVFGLPPN